jgi:hypothetical protein
VLGLALELGSQLGVLHTKPQEASQTNRQVDSE